jgi:hypothetical protein
MLSVLGMPTSLMTNYTIFKAGSLPLLSVLSLKLTLSLFTDSLLPTPYFDYFQTLYASVVYDFDGD